MNNSRFITVTLTKTIPVVNYNPKEPELNRIILDLANRGWDLSVDELKLAKPKAGGVILGED
jgi:hypothetical protein